MIASGNGCQENSGISRWLLKTEPGEYSWQDLKRDCRTAWDGVANFQAQNNLKKMRVGDWAFIYHTGRAKEIVGVAKIVEPFYRVKPEDRFGVVDVSCERELERAITLKELKSDPTLNSLAMFKQPRLSVVPLSLKEWALILKHLDGR